MQKQEDLNIKIKPDNIKKEIDLKEEENNIDALHKQKKEAILLYQKKLKNKNDVRALLMLGITDEDKIIFLIHTISQEYFKETYTKNQLDNLNKVFINIKTIKETIYLFIKYSNTIKAKENKELFILNYKIQDNDIFIVLKKYLNINNELDLNFYKLSGEKKKNELVKDKSLLQQKRANVKVLISNFKKENNKKSDSIFQNFRQKKDLVAIYKKSINFKNQIQISDKVEVINLSDYVIYNLNENNKINTYLVFQNKNTGNLNLYLINNYPSFINEIIFKDTSSTNINYYKSNINDYLIISTLSKKLHIYKINDNYKKIHEFDIKNGISWHNIMHIDNNQLYLITSSYDSGFSQLFLIDEINDNLIFKNNIINTNKNITNYLLIWKYQNESYLIELCIEKISIINLKNNTIYNDEFFKEYSLRNGVIISKNNKDILYMSTNKNVILYYDLILKQKLGLINNLNTNISWISGYDNKYLICSCSTANSIIFIEPSSKQTVTKISHKKLTSRVKIIENKSDNKLYLFMSDTNGSIYLFIN